MSLATAQSSDLLAASASVNTGRSILSGLTVITDGTNPATVIIYDNASAASGVVLAKVLCPAAQGTIHLNFSNRVRGVSGLYASISGTGAACIVYYGG